MKAMVAGVALVLIAALSGAATAATKDLSSPLTLNLPAQPLRDALNNLANQTGLEVIWTASDVTSARAAPQLVGRYTASAALDELLKGSGLTYEFLNPHTVAIVAGNRAEARILQQGGEGNSNVRGAIADRGLTLASTETAGSMQLVSAQDAVSTRSIESAKDKMTSDDTIEEVVVTARRREESLQNVPIAVSVLSGRQLVEQGVTDAISLANHVPALVINSANSGVMSKAFKVGIRDIQSTSNLLFDDPPSGTYFAEGVVAHPWGFGDTLYDIQSIQVLKGPQGTLFGRNTTGGAVLIEPNKASIEAGMYGDAKLTLGDYNLQQFDGMINIPLGDAAAVRFAGEHKKRDGYATNILTGQKLDGVGNNSVRVGLLVRPSQNIASNTIIDYLDEDASPTSSEVVAVFPPNGGFGLGGPLAASYANYSRILAEQQERGPWNVAEVGGTNGSFDQLSPVHCAANPYAYCRADWTPKETLTNGGILNNTQVAFDAFTVRNIAAYRAMHHHDESNYSFPGASPNSSLSPSGGGDADVTSKISQWQEELQFLGKALNNRLAWQTGVFAMREWGSELTPAYTNSVNWSESVGYDTNKSEGLYAQGTYTLTDRLKLTLGDRENWDQREAQDRSNATNTTTGITTCQVRVGSTAAFLPITNCLLSGDKSWQANTWTASLDFQIIDGTLVYIKADRGYHSGGFSLRSHRQDQFAYDPEFVTSEEVGLKSDWTLLTRPIRTNFAFFNLDYSDQQVQVTNPGTNPVTTYIANVGKSRIWGGEFEFTYKAAPGLELGGYLSYSNPKYLDYTNRFTATGPLVDLSNRPFGQPLYHANVSMAYTLPLQASLGSVTARVDATYRSRAIVDNSVAGLLGTPGAPPTAGFTQTLQSAFTLLNFRVDWTHPFHSPIDVAAFVTNATNEAYIQGGTPVNGLVAANIAPPRMFGVELNYAFGAHFKPQ